MSEPNQKEVRCPSCNKLLGKVRGREFSLETICGRCRSKVLFEVNPPPLAAAH
jgi:phage FluMu protein Com